MPAARRPEFEPAFGTRTTDEPIGPRPRGRHGEDVIPYDPDASDTSSVTPETPPAAGIPESGPASGEQLPGEQLPDEQARPAATVIGEPMLAPAGPDGAPVSRRSDTPILPPAAPKQVDVIESVEPVEPVGQATADPTPFDAARAAAGRVGTRWFRIRRRIVAGLALSVVLVLLYFLVTLAQVWLTGRERDDGPVDAIVVMGAAQYDGRPSPQLAARLDHVVELWPDGLAPLVVVTGGNIPGDRFTEAEASASYLVERGIPESALILENSGSNSYESLEAVAALLEARGLDEVLIVTDPYHALRSRLIAEEVGLDASVSSTDTSVVQGGESLTRHLKEAGGIAVGRIIGFDRLTRLVG